jgi:hypothetical protein
LSRIEGAENCFWLSGKKAWSIFMKSAVRGEKRVRKIEEMGAKSLIDKTGAAVARNFMSMSEIRDRVMMIAPMASTQRLSKA